MTTYSHPPACLAMLIRDLRGVPDGVHDIMFSTCIKLLSYSVAILQRLL